MSSADRFFSYFILCPPFATRFQFAIKGPLSAFPDLLHDGCLAWGGAVFHARSNKSGFDNIDFVRSASGLRKLHSAALASTLTNGDLSAFVALGLALVTFDPITSGAATRTITCFTLSLVCTSSPGACVDPRLEPDMLYLVFMDTVECMLRRQLPVLRYRVRDPTLVHRLVGLCAPLLPITYNVCQIAFESRSRSPSPRHFCPAFFDYLSALVATWQPLPPPDFRTTFTSQETTCLLIQANVLRIAILLVLHRL